MSDKNFLRCSVMAEGVALITIDQPPLNILSSANYHELCTEILNVIGRKEAKVIVVTGSHKVFISGLDIKEIKEIKTPEQNNELTLKTKALFRQIEKLPRPVIAAINGNCFGGGLELAMACHLRLASREAKMGLPEINVATIPTFGGTQRLPRIVGRGKAIELILTGRHISGGEAATIGLVNEVCLPEELLDRALALARQIASKSVMAIEAATRATSEAMEIDIEKGAALESHLSAGLVGTYNMREGIAAFLEKRSPVFEGR